jgi:uncharacterized protein (TIGR02145 family)
MKNFTWIFLALALNSYGQTPGDGVTDIDGNQYNSVIIGTQEWMKENLNVSKYSDGTIIPQVTDPTAWANLTTGAWCYYNNDSAIGAIYGKLYNWYAVAGIHDTDPNTANKILAPTAYHIPTDAEWTTLTTYLGGESVSGATMKSTGTTLWTSPNTGATNSSGFTGLPGGHREYQGEFRSVGYYGNWWNILEDDFNTNSAKTRSLGHISEGAFFYILAKSHGCSVRCLRDSSLSNTTFETNDFKLYPNPVVSILNIKIDNNLVNQTYTIVDGLGRMVLNGKLNDVESTINVEQLSKGIYYLKIACNSANKFIKE